MVDVIIGVRTHLIWLKCVESDQSRHYMINRGIPKKLRSSGDKHRYEQMSPSQDVDAVGV